MPAWKRLASGSEIRNPANDATFAQMRIRSLFFPGMSSRTARPARGVNRMMLSKCWSIRLPDHEIPQKCQGSHHYEERVPLHAASLEHAHGVGKHFHEEGTEAHGAIH